MDPPLVSNPLASALTISSNLVRIGLKGLFGRNCTTPLMSDALSSANNE